MAPRILSQSGSIVYGPGQYNRDYATSNGVAGYAKSMNQAKSDSRVQGNPLVIKGISTSGTSSTDLVVSDSDAGKIVRADGSHGLLNNCRVMFLLD